MEVLFKRNPDIKKNAYPNWRRSNYSSWEFKTYSEMYKKSGDLLIDTIADNYNNRADEVIIPSIFLYRHATELILKAILLTHYLMDRSMSREKIQDKLQGHSLFTLWNKVENIIPEYLKEAIKKDKSPLQLMKAAVMELHEIDSTSMMFRYPFDKEYKEAQLIGDEEHNYGIDYIALKQQFNEVYNYIEGVFYTLFNRYENLETIPIL
ncbi:hypothetical protein IM700_010090 [Paenibacillus sp. DXFW5]|uniref:HEPN domain-containing protein n=2 Tax=Paenibacillus TaxID=44249 RepID=A0ABS2H3D8_9BACL|nr:MULTISPECIES: hypothetical protein [Paenibacillus]MBM6995995.1 hypothetical protein [Paenibacillus rhizolycopersici]GIP49368.1 hypothetical protein J53TS2_29590 [Paenibacillus sp. J53TS2]